MARENFFIHFHMKRLKKKNSKFQTSLTIAKIGASVFIWSSGTLILIDQSTIAIIPIGIAFCFIFCFLFIILIWNKVLIFRSLKHCVTWACALCSWINQPSSKRITMPFAEMSSFFFRLEFFKQNKYNSVFIHFIWFSGLLVWFGVYGWLCDWMSECKEVLQFNVSLINS